MSSGRYGEGWWKENLRMSQDMFEVLCRELKPHIKKQTTYMRMPESIEERVAVTLWRLATNIAPFQLSLASDGPQLELLLLKQLAL